MAIMFAFGAATRGASAGISSLSGLFGNLGAKVVGLNQAFQLASSGLGMFERAISSVYDIVSKSINAYAEVEKNLIRVRFETEGTAASMKGVSDSMAEVASRFGKGQKEISGAAAALADLGASGEQLSFLLPLATEVADALGIGMNEAATIVGKSMNVFQKDLIGTEVLMDKFIAIAQKASIPIDELVASLGAAKGALSGVQGVTEDDVLPILAILRNSGIDVGQGLGVLSAGLSKLSKGELPVGRGFEKLQKVLAYSKLTIEDLNFSQMGLIGTFEALSPGINALSNDAERLAVLEGVLGREGAAAGLQIIKQMESVKKLRDALKESRGATANAAAAAREGMGPAMERTSAAFGNLFVSIGKVIGEGGPLIGFLGTLEEFLKNVAAGIEQIGFAGLIESAKKIFSPEVLAESFFNFLSIAGGGMMDIFMGVIQKIVSWAIKRALEAIALIAGALAKLLSMALDRCIPDVVERAMGINLEEAGDRAMEHVSQTGAKVLKGLAQPFTDALDSSADRFIASGVPKIKEGFQRAFVEGPIGQEVGNVVAAGRFGREQAEQRGRDVRSAAVQRELANRPRTKAEPRLLSLDSMALDRAIPDVAERAMGINLASLDSMALDRAIPDVAERVMGINLAEVLGIEGAAALAGGGGNGKTINQNRITVFNSPGPDGTRRSRPTKGVQNQAGGGR
jgi:TP901 family phage tail tape measure protein